MTSFARVDKFRTSGFDEKRQATTLLRTDSRLPSRSRVRAAARGHFLSLDKSNPRIGVIRFDRSWHANGKVVPRWIVSHPIPISETTGVSTDDGPASDAASFAIAGLESAGSTLPRWCSNAEIPTIDGSESGESNVVESSHAGAPLPALRTSRTEARP